MTEQGPEAEHVPQAVDQRLETETQPDARAKLCALEAVLFMAAEPLSLADLAEILDVVPQVADELVSQLEAEYGDRGMLVQRVAGGLQVATRPEYGHYVAKLHKPERFRLSRAALETLAIVAYRQPATRPEIDAIRGVNSDSPLDTLLQYELVCEAGRKDAPGRPLLYRTTDSFLGRFGLNSIADLPGLDTIPTDEAEIRAAVSVSQEGEPGETLSELPEAAREEQPATAEDPPGPDSQEQSPE
jgi:segregation and condensation protein B